MMNINTIITLINNEKYYLLEKVQYNNKTYFLASKMENDNLSIRDSIILEMLDEDNVSKVTDEHLIYELLKIFKEMIK